jgi:uncharacterized membrane protein
MHSILHGIQVVFGAIYIIFLPGFALSFLFFKRDDRHVDVIERVALSFALSVAVVPLVTFYLNLVGVKIKTVSVIAEVAAIILISLVVGYFTKRFEKEQKHEKE